MTQQNALARIQAALAKKHGDIVTTMEAGNVGLVRGAVTGPLETLDRYLLGINGLAWERISEVYGAESSGKSSYVMGCLGAIQRIGGVGVYVDAENACTQERAEVFGIDRSQLLMVSDLENAEQGLQVLYDAVKAHHGKEPMLAVYDSVPAAVTKAEAESESEDHHMAPLARLMSKMVPRFVQLLRGKNAHVLFVNQTREKPGVMFGSPEYTPGGKALKFYASARLSFRGVKVRDGGLEVKVRCIKNKLSEPRREMTTFLNFKKGWDDGWTTLNHAKDLGLIKKDSRNVVEARRALGWPARELEVEAPGPAKKARKGGFPEKPSEPAEYASYEEADAVLAGLAGVEEEKIEASAGKKTGRRK
jgi:protein RecA